MAQNGPIPTYPALVQGSFPRFPPSFSQGMGETSWSLTHVVKTIPAAPRTTLYCSILNPTIPEVKQFGVWKTTFWTTIHRSWVVHGHHPESLLSNLSAPPWPGGPHWSSPYPTRRTMLSLARSPQPRMLWVAARPPAARRRAENWRRRGSTGRCADRRSRTGRSSGCWKTQQVGGGRRAWVGSVEVGGEHLFRRCRCTVPKTWTFLLISRAKAQVPPNPLMHFECARHVLIHNRYSPQSIKLHDICRTCSAVQQTTHQIHPKPFRPLPSM